MLQAMVRATVLQTERAIIKRVAEVLFRDPVLQHWVTEEQQASQVFLMQDLARGTPALG
jgi:hypothetical protein